MCAHPTQTLHRGNGAVAEPEVRDSGSDLHDLAGCLQAGRIGKRFGTSDRPIACPDLEVGMVDCPGKTAQANFIGLKRRKRHGLEAENIGPAIPAHDDRAASANAIVSRHRPSFPVAALHPQSCTRG